MSHKAEKKRNTNSYGQTTGPPTGRSRVLITTKSKERENKRHVVLIVAILTLKVTGQDWKFTLWLTGQINWKMINPFFNVK